MENAHTIVDPLAEAYESEIAPKLEMARQNLARLNERALTIARERPVTCLVGALALGFVVGKIAARF